MARSALIVAAMTLAAGAAAAQAQARIVFVKRAAANPQVYVAADDGSHQRRLVAGMFPKLSPDGRWVAYLRDDELRLVRARGGRSRFILRGGVGDVHWAPDSRAVGADLFGSLRVYDLRARRLRRIGGAPTVGWSFSPDSRWIVYGRSERRDFDAPADLYIVSAHGRDRHRLTHNRRSLVPLWTRHGIVFDEQVQRRPRDTNALDLFSIAPDGTAERRITTTRVPRLANGLMPWAASADGSRVLAEFYAQDEIDSYAVDVATGAARKLATDLFPGTISRDGRTILAHTGGPDPFDRHSVIAVPFDGGPLRLLVRGASDPDWNR